MCGHGIKLPQIFPKKKKNKEKITKNKKIKLN